MLCNTAEESLCHAMVKWSTASVSQVSTLGISSSACDRVFDLMKTRNVLLKLGQTTGWCPTVRCTRLRAGSKQIMPQAKQLGTVGCGHRHNRPLRWFTLARRNMHTAPQHLYLKGILQRLGLNVRNKVMK